jgi:latrophilin 1
LKASEDEVKESVSCEHEWQGNSDRQISCPDGKFIDVVDAWYGRQTSDVCNPYGSASTYFRVPTGGCKQDAYKVIDGRCTFKQSCSIKLDNGMVGDPCFNVTKYSFVQFKCKSYNIAYVG